MPSSEIPVEIKANLISDATAAAGVLLSSFTG